jgi:hypothetical protein
MSKFTIVLILQVLANSLTSIKKKSIIFLIRSYKTYSNPYIKKTTVCDLNLYLNRNHI